VEECIESTDGYSYPQKYITAMSVFATCTRSLSAYQYLAFNSSNAMSFLIDLLGAPIAEEYAGVIISTNCSNGI
jgi:hypothetical protein